MQIAHEAFERYLQSCLHKKVDILSNMIIIGVATIEAIEAAASYKILK